MNTATQIKKMATEVSSVYLERNDLIRGILLAILSRQHLFTSGVPGVAKSAIVNEVNSRITGAKMFSALLDKFSPPEVVFGPVSIKALQEDRYERAIDGYMPDAHIAFLDEIWKCNSSLLNALLTLINERVYKNGRNTIQSPLISVVGASNETPEEDSSLGAMYDRFLLRYIARPVSHDNVPTLLSPELFKTTQNKATITLDQLKEAQKDVVGISVGKDMLKEIADIKLAVEREGFFASDRRWRHSIQLLQASAYMDERKEVELDDCQLYANVLWDRMEDQPKLASLIGKLINPKLQRIIDHVDAIANLLKEYEKGGGGSSAAADLYQKVLVHKEKLGTLDAGAKGEELKTLIEAKAKAALFNAMKAKTIIKEEK